MILHHLLAPLLSVFPGLNNPATGQHQQGVVYSYVVEDPDTFYASCCLTKDPNGKSVATRTSWRLAGGGPSGDEMER